MTMVTLRVLDGADRGRAYENLPTPVTIGREEGNSVQLNDERVSRFHIKIQEDDNKLVLTDLESTNGTKVNGESVQLWILRHGDVISVGRSVLLYGSEDEIARRLASLRGVDLSRGINLDADDAEDASPSVSLEFELNWSDDPDARVTLHTLLPPELPERLSPGQNAQLSELLQYIHLRIRNLVQSAEVMRKSEKVTLPQRRWQDLLDIESRLARYLRSIGEPE
jgi:pSer/pThr/pTyr-binding forkhead associated (FHA) protein